MRRLLLLVALVLPVAACGGSSTETVSVVEATVTQTTVLTVKVEPALTTPTFQLPSRNIGCMLGEGVLVCDILSGLNPEPDEQCELDWTGMEMERLGPAQPRCAGDTAYDQKAPVLAYGTSWAAGGFTCESSQDGLLCRNEESHGFSLAREVWKAF
jgi:hypothetical protein